MAATGVRLTLKFNFAQQIRLAGWSESYDLGYADLTTALTSINQINAFINDRCFCLGQGPYLVEALLSAYVQPPNPGAPPPKRPSIPIAIPPFPNPIGTAYNPAFNMSPGAPADFAPTVYYIGLNTSLGAVPVYRRNCWIAGLPDQSDLTNTNTIVDPLTLTAVNKFLKDLSNAGTSLASKNNVSVRSIDHSGLNPIKQCTAWNLAVNTYTVPAHGFVANQPVLAVGMTTQKGGTAPRGRYLVGTIIDANTITLQGAGTPTAPVKTGGFRPAVYTFNTVSNAVPQGFTKRDKGRPSGLSVGRRRRPATERV